MVEIKSVLTRCCMAAAIVLCIVGAHAEEGPLSVELAAQKVVVAEDGKQESFGPADQAEPGDVIEYVATYSNGGEGQLQNIKPVLPIPVGMAYLPQSAAPGDVQASVDGELFAPVPLTERIVDASGKVEIKKIPYERYRYLRWSVPKLAPGQQVAIKARVRVANGEDDTNTLTKAN